MEPASTLATAALAVAIMLPSVQVSLKNWENKRDTIINVYQCKNSSPQGKQFAQLMPGYNGTPIPVMLKKDGFSLTLVRLIPADISGDRIDILIAGIIGHEDSSFEVACTAKHKKSSTEELGLGISQEKVSWKTKNPPYSITFEIDGIIGTLWDNAQVSINKRTKLLEKFK